MFWLLACASSDPSADPSNNAPVACEGDDGPAAPLTIAPYLQSVTPTSAWILWETTDGIGSRVEYGPTEALGEVACGGLVPTFADGDPADATTQVHEVQLTDLAPSGTTYYRVRTGETISELHRFRTAPPAGDAGPFRVVALGDGQRDDANPDKYREVIHDGVIAHTHATIGPELSEELALVVYAGDLVDNGWVPTDWTHDFFGFGAPLMAEVPFYPVIGNHEGNSPLYFRYFHLPEDGDDEHWYTTDYANLRVIGLDSNPPYDDDAQLVWLDAALDRTCADTAIDFVFVQLHHPHRSELWTPGESDWSGDVVARLEAFSTACGKPSIHFFGHTHAYSRGASRDHQHAWVNVSSAGGALDRWGEQVQADYPEFSVSQDTWGFVMVEVQGGESPSFKVERVSRGNPDAPDDNTISDAFTVWRDNRPPDTPVAESSSPCAVPPVLRASAFADPDGHTHQATHWQVASDCSDFSVPFAERWRQVSNVYMNVDLQAGDDLTDEPFEELTGTDACWRVRYRDEGLVWSAWSAPSAWSTASCP